jgi:enterochelin esterase-like enzyme
MLPLGPILALVLVTAAAAGTPPKVILDTDPSFDPDDAGCMAMLHKMATDGEVEILAMMNSTHFREGPLSISAINHYYHRGAIPVGDYKADGKTEAPSGNYDHYIANHYPRDLESDEDAPEASSLYREILASSPDGSVTIVVIGTMHNIAQLLASLPDTFSELGGRELVARKVNRIVTMGGNFIDGRGVDRANWGGSDPLCAFYDWACLNPSRNELTRYVIDESPVPFIASGWEVGCGDFHDAGQGTVNTGQALKGQPADHVIRRAYEHHYASRGGDEDITRHSNDQCALLYAVRGARDYFTEHLDGAITLGEDGTTEWSSAPDRGAGYIRKKASPAVLEEVIEGLMIAPVAEADLSPPDSPRGLTATPTGEGVWLEWSPAEDPTPGSWVVRYDVSRDGHPIGRAHGTRFLDAGADADHEWSVAAVNTNGLPSRKVRVAALPPRWVVPPDATTLRQLPGLRHQTFESEAMGTRVGFNVVLPPGYDYSRTSYPVVYWLHGGGGNESSDLATAQTWLGLYDTREVRSVILVYPNGHRSGYMDHADGKTMVESMIVRELVPIVESRFRTIPSRDGRAVHGFSMGASGALKLLFKYPDLFASAVAYGGGSIDLESTEDPWILDILDRNLASDPGRIRENNTYRFLEENHGVVRAAGGEVLLICGSEDPWLQSAVDFRTALERKGVPVELLEVEGSGHDLGALVDARGRDAALFQDEIFSRRRR